MEDVSAKADGTEAALRAALLARPQDWRTALALKSRLAALGRFAEADDAFRQARACFPDPVWLDHLATLYAYPQAELAALTERGRALAQAAPADPLRARLLGNLLLQGRRYTEAAEAYVAATDADSAVRRKEALGYLALAGLLRARQSSGPAPSLAVVNLDRNTERLAETERQFAACRMPRFRVPGVVGGLLPGLAVGRLGGDAALRGTLGCFLSHVAAWEAMLARGDAHCLVVEDDTIPLLDLPERWGVFGLDAGFDLCFVNDRLAPRATGAGFRAMRLAEAMAAFPPERHAPGADGYLLSADGARKLLARVQADGFGGDVDWRLLSYALPEAERACLPPGSTASKVLAGLPGWRDAPLHALVLSPPLIRSVSVDSEREAENRRA